MKREYLEPEVETLCFNEADIITTSTVEDNDDFGDIEP